MNHLKTNNRKIYVRAYLRVSVRMCVLTEMCKYANVCVCVYKCVYVCVCARARVYACVCRVCVYVCAYVQ